MAVPSIPSSSVSFADAGPASPNSARLLARAHSRGHSDQTPAQILKQLTSSIPEKEYKMMVDWKVTQACITKVSQSSQSTTPTSSDEKKKPSQPVGRSLSRMGTSKIHKFKPVVTLTDALQWLSEYGNADSTLVFENDCCLMFQASTYEQFEDVRDDPEEGEDDDHDPDQRPPESDEDS